MLLYWSFSKCGANLPVQFQLILTMFSFIVFLDIMVLLIRTGAGLHPLFLHQIGEADEHADISIFFYPRQLAEEDEITGKLGVCAMTMLQYIEHR